MHPTNRPNRPIDYSSWCIDGFQDFVHYMLTLAILGYYGLLSINRAI